MVESSPEVSADQATETESQINSLLSRAVEKEQKALEKEKDELIALKKDIDRKKSILDKKKLQKMMEELQERTEKLQTKTLEIQQKLLTKEKEMTADIVEEIRAIVIKIAKDNPSQRRFLEGWLARLDRMRKRMIKV